MFLFSLKMGKKNIFGKNDANETIVYVKCKLTKNEHFCRVSVTYKNAGRELELSE
jgi:hypothetical protein